MATKTCNVTYAARNHFTNRVDGILGLAGDIRNRMYRLLGKQPATTHEQELTNEDDSLQQTIVMLDIDATGAYIENETIQIPDYDAETLFVTKQRLDRKLAKFQTDINEAITRTGTPTSTEADMKINFDNDSIIQQEKRGA